MPVIFLLGGTGRQLFLVLAREPDNAKNLDVKLGGVQASASWRLSFGEVIDQSAVANGHVSLNLARPHWATQLSQTPVKYACFRIKMRLAPRPTHQSLELLTEYPSW